MFTHLKRENNRLYALGALLIISIIISGCAVGTSGRLFINKSPEKTSNISLIDITEAESPSLVSVPSKIKIYFDDRLKEQIYKDGHYQKGPDLRIEYKFIEVQPGSRFLRYLFGALSGVGNGSLIVDIKYIDSSGNELSSVEVESKVNGGLFGGSFNSAIDRAVDEIAKYTKENFR